MGDMTITVHALERMEERWPDFTDNMTDDEIARFIQGEVNDALVAGRRSSHCPLELANSNSLSWGSKATIWYCWIPQKLRGYVCRNDGDGIIVLTTLVGAEREEARKKLIRKQHRGKIR